MTNIKNNKLLQLTKSAAFTKVAAANAGLLKPSTADVPFFKNPHQTDFNSNLQLEAKVTEADIVSDFAAKAVAAAAAATSSVSYKKEVAAKGLTLFASQPSAEAATASLLGLTLSSNNNYKPNLMFLQKKGSQIPNPYIISYNFPAASHNQRLLLPCKARPSTKASSEVYKLLFNFFKSMYCLISKPVFITTPNKIKIQLFYFLCIPNQRFDSFVVNSSSPATALNLTKVYPYKFKLICTILSKFFNKNVELELIRLHQPYFDSNILVNFLALIINKKNIGACIQRLYNSNIIKSNKAATAKATTAAYLSGLNIKISGRLMREPIIPRITTKKFEKGFTAKGKINYFDLARFTHKNRKGAFTITVKSGQNF
jgi:hypothetical protein